MPFTTARHSAQLPFMLALLMLGCALGDSTDAGECRMALISDKCIGEHGALGSTLDCIICGRGASERLTAACSPRLIDAACSGIFMPPPTPVAATLPPAPVQCKKDGSILDPSGPS